jgi:hypothetical protein
MGAMEKWGSHKGLIVLALDFGKRLSVKGAFFLKSYL